MSDRKNVLFHELKLLSSLIYSPVSPVRTQTVHTQAFSAVSAHTAVDLKACRQAFLAVLASVCDPHLNTIHAVCAQFALARGHRAGILALNPPRPPNRPLNMNCPPGENHIDFAYDIDFSNLTPTSMYIPDQNSCGPLSIPGLEPVHPVAGYEMDASQTWQCVLEIVDMSQIDAEELATRVAERVRCYGYGPVLTRSDVVLLCHGEHDTRQKFILKYITGYPQLNLL